MSFRFQVSGSKFQVPSFSTLLPRFVLLLRFPDSPIPRFASRLLFLILCSVSISGSVATLAGCGRKTLVRPPELVAPKEVNDLTLEAKGKTIILHWGRVQDTVGGESLDELGGFVVLRATQDAEGKTSEFSQVATIPVEDRDRFRKNRKFNYTDEQLTVGTLYRYRVLTFTLDGYYGGASNTVELVWRGGS